MRRFHLVLFVLLAIGMSAQVDAVEIIVPNGGFELFKPGTNYTLDSARLRGGRLSDQPEFWHSGDVRIFDDDFLEVMRSVSDREKLRKAGAEGAGDNHFRRCLVLVHRA